MKLTIIIAINRFVSSVNFRNRADKALTEKSSERRALVASIIRSFGIQCFDYLQTQKQQITKKNSNFQP